MVYQLFLTWVPFIYITFLGMLAFGAAIGFTVGYLMRLGKTRNLMVAAIVGGICGLTGYTASFQFDYDYRLSETAEYLSITEGRTVTTEDVAEKISYRQYIELRAEQGFRIGGDNGLLVSGFLMYLIWFIELFCIVGLASYLAYLKIRDPFCEKCQNWMLERPVGLADAVDDAALELAVSKCNIESLLHPKEVVGSPKAVVYSTYACVPCQRSDYLTVSLRWEEMNRKGEPEENSKVLVRHLIVSPDQVTALEQTLDAYDEGAATT